MSASTFTDLASAAPLPPKWVVENLLPPGLTILGAPPKSSKSTFAMALACLVSDHECLALPPSMRTVRAQGRVLVFSYEANAGELRHMVERGLKVRLHSGIKVADDPFNWRLDDPDALEALMEWLEGAGLEEGEDVDAMRPRLVIFDPLRNFHSLDEKDSGDMIRLLAPLRSWAVDNDAAVLVVHHTRKPSEETKGATYDPLDLRGSGALFGIADAVLMLTPKKSGHLTLSATFKRAPSYEVRFTFGAYGVEDGAEVIDEKVRLFCNLIGQGAAHAAACEQLGLKGADLPRALETLKRNHYMRAGVVTQEGRVWARSKEET